MKNILQSIEIHKKYNGFEHKPDIIYINTEKNFRQFQYCINKKIKPLCTTVVEGKLVDFLSLSEDYGIHIKRYKNKGSVIDIEIIVYMDQYEKVNINYKIDSQEYKLDLLDFMSLSLINGEKVELANKDLHILKLFDNIINLSVTPLYDTIHNDLYSISIEFMVNRQ